MTCGDPIMSKLIDQKFFVFNAASLIRGSHHARNMIEDLEKFTEEAHKFIFCSVSLLNESVFGTFTLHLNKY